MCRRSVSCNDALSSDASSAAWAVGGIFGRQRRVSEAERKATARGLIPGRIRLWWCGPGTSGLRPDGGACLARRLPRGWCTRAFCPKGSEEETLGATLAARHRETD